MVIYSVRGQCNVQELQYETRDEHSNLWVIARQASERAEMRDGSFCGFEESSCKLEGFI